MSGQEEMLYQLTSILRMEWWISIAIHFNPEPEKKLRRAATCRSFQRKGKSAMLERKERSQRKIYPVGYGMDGAASYIEQLMTQPQMLLIDTRFSPKSRWTEWREGALRARYGTRYRWAGAYLGNVNFEGGPIQLADAEEGLRGLHIYL